MSWTMTMTGAHWEELHGHLFPGDGDEHGAVLRCGIARGASGNRLLVREVLLARDGVDYVSSDRGYRKLAAAFVLDVALRCADDRSVYIAVHCHRGTDQVGFSETDLASHSRGYPNLLDLIDGPMVGALVLAEGASAGDLWLAGPRGERAELTSLVIIDPTRRTLTPSPRGTRQADQTYERQARLFGDRGQAILASLTVAVVGLGGAGSLIAQMLTRLGVGHLIFIDPDKIETSNLSRVVGATRRDAASWFTDPARPRWLRKLGGLVANSKVRVAVRLARQSGSHLRIDAIQGAVEDPDVARLLLASDHIFLAADTATARLVVNAIAHQYLIPTTQVGAKVVVDQETGDVVDVFVTSRLLIPGHGCLKCNGLISPRRLREEATDPAQLERQRYVEDAGVHAPSVITLNAVAASQAVNEWLLSVTGLSEDVDPAEWVHIDALASETSRYRPRQDPDCSMCGPTRFAQGDAVRLPTKLRQ